MNTKILLLVGLFIFLTIVDLLANIISFIPLIGDLMETGLEVIIESIQLGIVAILVAMAGRK
jgi:hypothetical protein